VAEVEDAAQVAPDERAVGELAERAERDRVVDAVAHERAALDRLELVDVVPELVGTADLPIDERAPFLPALDPGSPAHRDAVKLQPILDQRAGLHPDRLWCDDLEAEPARSDPLEIARRGIELEDLVDRPRDYLLALKGVSCQGRVLKREAVR